MTNAARKISKASRLFSLAPIALAAKDGDAKRGVPDWLMIMPAGDFHSNDGRFWRNPNPDDFIAQTMAGGLVPPVDVNHGMEYGSSEPAMGWVAELQNRDGAIWARVEWTAIGHAAVLAREYRYVSPSFTHDETLLVFALTSLALVNKPALLMPALTSAISNMANASQSSNMEQPIMDDETLAKWRKILKLAEDADEAAVTAALDAAAEDAGADAGNGEGADAADVSEGGDPVTPADASEFTAENPDPTLFVPRADYDAVVAADIAGTSGDGEASDPAVVEAALTSAIASGRIVPATKAYHAANCATVAGLKNFNNMVKGSAKIVPTEPQTALAASNGAPAGVGTALTSAQLEICELTNVAPKDFAAQLKREASNA